jgi:hypothetical protein
MKTERTRHAFTKVPAVEVSDTTADATKNKSRQTKNLLFISLCFEHQSLKKIILFPQKIKVNCLASIPEPLKTNPPCLQ